MIKKVAVAVLSVGVLAGGAWAGSYDVDAAHADVGFTVKHLGINKVRGRFSEASGQVQYDGQNLSSLKVTASMKAASIDTGISKRDDHLKGADFFEADAYPEITFESTGAVDGKLNGTLTMHGVTKPVSLDVEVNGPVDNPWDPTKAVIAVELTGEINRHDFGVGTGEGTDKLVGDTVKLQINAEAGGAKEQLKAAEAPAAGSGSKEPAMAQ